MMINDENKIENPQIESSLDSKNQQSVATRYGTPPPPPEVKFQWDVLGTPLLEHFDIPLSYPKDEEKLGNHNQLSLQVFNPVIDIPNHIPPTGTQPAELNHVPKTSTGKCNITKKQPLSVATAIEKKKSLLYVFTKNGIVPMGDQQATRHLLIASRIRIGLSAMGSRTLQEVQKNTTLNLKVKK